MNEAARSDGRSGRIRQSGEPAQARRFASRFLEALADRPLVLDAGIGTRLVELGLDLRNDDPSLWNVTHGDVVREIHGRDLAAGADAILTNTFGANRCWLSRFGRELDVVTINRRAVELARQAARPDRWVIGDIGPTAALADAHVEQAAILIERGVDALILETYLAEPALLLVGELKRNVSDSVPILVSLREWPTYSPDFERTARRLVERGASVLGINCQPDIDAAVAFAEKMSLAVPCPLLVKPGVYPLGGPGTDPSEFAAAIPALLASNVRLIGGCCGTTHLHVAAIAASIPISNRARPPLRIGEDP